MDSKQDFLRAASIAFAQAKKAHALDEGVEVVGFRPGVFEAEDLRFTSPGRMLFKGIYKKHSYRILVDWKEDNCFTVTIGPYVYNIVLKEGEAC